ncbi:hypothetical protein GCM10027610_143590 [Dactylosporangium cerinum]
MRLLHEPCAVLGIADVRTDEGGPDAELLDLGRGVLGGGEVGRVVDDHVETGAGQGEGDAPADPAGRAGHQRRAHAADPSPPTPAASVPPVAAVSGPPVASASGPPKNV